MPCPHGAERAFDFRSQVFAVLEVTLLGPGQPGGGPRAGQSLHGSEPVSLGRYIVSSL